MDERGVLASCTVEVWNKVKQRLEGPGDPVWKMTDAKFNEVFKYEGSLNHVPLYFLSEKGDRQLRTFRLRTGFGNDSRATLWSIMLARYRYISCQKTVMKSMCGDAYCFNPWCASNYVGQLSKRKKEDMMKDRRTAKRMREEDPFSDESLLSQHSPGAPGQESDGYSSASFLSEPSVHPNLLDFENSIAADSSDGYDSSDSCAEDSEFSQDEVPKKEEEVPRFDPSFYHNGKLILKKLTENDPLFHELLTET